MKLFVSSHYGFTLIELASTLVIIGLLASTATSSMRNVLRTAEVATIHAKGKQWKTAISLYYAKQGRLPYDITEFTTLSNSPASSHETISFPSSGCTKSSNRAVICKDTYKYIEMAFFHFARSDTHIVSSSDRVTYSYLIDGQWHMCGNFNPSFPCQY